MRDSLVYVVLNRYTGFIYGVFRDKKLAEAQETKYNNELGYENGQKPVRISSEPVMG